MPAVCNAAKISGSEFTPAWIKATVGFALPVMANVAEVVRGAVRSLPSTQWEAAEALAFTRRQTMWRIILPQCVKRMLPPWMNIYSLVTMSTVLASIVGVSEMLTLTAQVHAAADRLHVDQFCVGCRWSAVLLAEEQSVDDGKLQAAARCQRRIDRGQIGAKRHDG